MIRFFLIALAVMTAICAAAILIAVMQGKRAAKAKREAASLHDAFWDVKQKAERLQKTLGKAMHAEEEADAERKDLAGTPDYALVGRANGLFNGPKK
jgi:type VI protein secretion system component VasK